MTSTIAQVGGGVVTLDQAVQDRLRRAFDKGELYRPYRYQSDRLNCGARFHFDIWSRQIGKTAFLAGFDSVMKASELGDNVIILSAGMDQVMEVFSRYVAPMAEVVWNIAGDIQRSLIAGELDSTHHIDEHGHRITQTIVELPNGARIVGRPANPRTARGYTGHYKLDEFDMHRDQKEIWGAAFGTITSNKRFGFDVMTTPFAPQGWARQVWRMSQAGEMDFVCRKVTLLDAVRDGYAGGDLEYVEQMRRNIGDDDLFRREYMCEWTDAANALLTVELIMQAEREGLKRRVPGWPTFVEKINEQHRITQAIADIHAASMNWSRPETLGWDPSEGDLYLGIDYGRTNDLTVQWLDQRVGDKSIARFVVAMQNVDFNVQSAFTDAIFRALPIRRCCIDQTGMGIPMLDFLKRRHGTHCVEGVTFSMKTKAEMAEYTAARFQDRNVEIPIDRVIRNDLNSVRIEVTPGGNRRYAGERTKAGHADYFWAKALAEQAAWTPGVTPAITELM